MTSKRFLRRNLIKGALAAPAVFSVRTASAQANYASQCVMQGNQRAAIRRPAVLADVDHDEWLRTPLDVYHLAVYQGAQLKPVDGKYVLGIDKVRYWRINDGPTGRGGGATPTSSATPTSHMVGRCVATRTGEVKHGLVYVDGSGQMVGVAFEPRNGMPALESCMHSVNPGMVNARRT